LAVIAKSRLKVADEVWIAAARLHREQPTRPDFTVEEIVARALEDAPAPARRGSVYVHVVQHCVANRPPNPARYRMLFETAPGRRRLFRSGDAYHPAREGSKTVPSPDDLPQGYTDLLVWYRQWSSAARERSPKTDPLLSLLGSGKELWADEPADQYVRRLREGWE